MDRRTVRTLGIGAVIGLALTPIYWRLVNNSDPLAFYLGINDYDIHVTSSRFITFLPFRMDVPHFVFHLSSAFTSRMVGEQLGPVIVLVLASIAVFVLVTLLMRRPDDAGRRLSAEQAEGATLLWGLLETPTMLLLYLGLLAPTTRFMSIHGFYSPTWVTALPFSLLTLLMVDRLLTELRERGDRQSEMAWGVAIVLFVATIAKPALALCLLPGLSVYLIVLRIPVGVAAALMARIAVPTGLLLVWQTWYLTSGQSEVWVDKFAFDPIGGPIYGWSQARWAFWLPFLWVMLAVWATAGRFFRDRLVQLIGCCLVFAVAIYLLLVEVGDRAGHGNLGVPLQLCVAVLFLLATRAIAVEAVGTWARRNDEDFPWWFRVGGMLTVTFVAGGLLAYSDTLGLVQLPISWFPLY